MIEIPERSVADEICRDSSVLQLRNQRPHQTTMGMSRDDSGSFLPIIRELDILDANPFASVDQSGVGQLMEIAVKKGKSKRGIKLGYAENTEVIPKASSFATKLGLNYVSCSPLGANCKACGCSGSGFLGYNLFEGIL